MERVEVDWEEEELVRWLGTITRSKTRACYKEAFVKYTLYTDMTAKELIDEAIEDAKRDPREKKDVLKTRLLGFYNWLTTEYPIYSRGKGERKLLRKGVRSKSAHMYVNAIRSFYGTYDLHAKFKRRERLPKAKVYNKRMRLDITQVRTLVDHARTPRDRAIILTLFQGGMDASTLCSLNYGDIAKGLESGKHPIRVPSQLNEFLIRPKTGVAYYTFLGMDAIEAIKAYLNDARMRGIEFSHQRPLFVQETSMGEPIRTSNVQKVLRETALRSGLVDEKNNGKDQNPASPHALRESFGSIMINVPTPDTLVDFWLGHDIGEMAKAYKEVKFEELKRMYAEREKFISITVPESEAVEKMEERIKELLILVSKLTAENTELRKELREVKGDVNVIHKSIGWLTDRQRETSRLAKDAYNLGNKAHLWIKTYVQKKSAKEKARTALE